MPPSWQTAFMRASARSSLVVVVTAAVALTGCSGDDGSAAVEQDPQAALEAAGEHIDEADGIRFTVDSDDLPDSGTVVLSADGVAAPPASFSGDLRIRAGAVPATIGVISIDDRLWAQLPFSQGFEEIQADELEGFGDPGKLLDPEHGVSRLLTAGTDVAAGDQVRVDGEVYDQVESTLPGELVGTILAIAEPDAEVHATWALEPETGRLRQATLTGPFYSGGEQTYTVHLDDYDEPVDISAPTD